MKKLYGAAAVFFICAALVFQAPAEAAFFRTSAPEVEIDEEEETIFSPDGERFVLVTGSGIRPDITYEVYGEGGEKLAEFDGIRGMLEWIDPVRFVFTRIDDTREGEGGTFINVWRVSVIMYDTAIREEIVLKEATDTKNFWFDEVIEDGAAVTATEEYVKSEKDWTDEDKIKTREIRVEIPAAG